jgi:asparagine synthase (glutamine-hydrolysing)
MKAASVLAKNKLPAKAIEYFKNPDTPNAEYKLIRGLFTDHELNELGWHSESQMSNSLSRTGFGIKSQKVKSVDSGSESGMTINQSFNHPINQTSNLEPNNPHTPLQHVSFLESCFYMRNQLLRDSDVFSMAHSLELRVPFVDHLLYGAVLPYLDGGFDRKYPKKMLVDAVGDLPYEVVNRPKQGFTFPFADWIKSGKIKDSINDSLMSSNMTRYFNKNSLLKLQKDFEYNKIHWSRVWAMSIISRF